MTPWLGCDFDVLSVYYTAYVGEYFRGICDMRQDGIEVSGLKVRVDRNDATDIFGFFEKRR